MTDVPHCSVCGDLIKRSLNRPQHWQHAHYVDDGVLAPIAEFEYDHGATP